MGIELILWILRGVYGVMGPQDACSCLGAISLLQLEPFKNYYLRLGVDDSWTPRFSQFSNRAPRFGQFLKWEPKI